MLSVLRRVATPLRRRVSSLSPEHLVDGLIDGNRAALSRAITLIESTRPSHHEDALALLASAHHRCRAAERESFRVGIAGPPGAGKSTFIEAFGLQLIEAGHRVAVVAVDPSSVTRGGSILGDKTRMPDLTARPEAFVRPSPSRGVLGGIGLNTNDVVFLCEAARFDIVIVESVGLGQV